MADEKQESEFFDRADALIALANEQCREVSYGTVSASFLYDAARFNSWVSACSAGSKVQMQDEKQQIIRYFTSQYEKMLTENIDDYIDNFDSYMTPGDGA